MEGTKLAVSTSLSPPPEVVQQFDQAEYNQLLADIETCDTQFKVGAVDKIFPGSDISFEQKLLQVEQLVSTHRKKLAAEHPLIFFRFTGLNAEAKEYFGTSTAGYELDLFAFAQELFQDLLKEPPPTEPIADPAERELLSCKIRVIVAGLQYLLRVGHLASALTYGRKLYEFVTSRGLGTPQDLGAPLAIVYQFLGKTLRARGLEADCEDAIGYFYRCNDAYSEIALVKGLRREEVIYARTRAALSLGFGAGLLFFSAKGDLARAKDSIRPARLAFLRDDGDVGCELYSYYFELLYASVLREEAGELSLISHDDPSQLEVEAIIARGKLTHVQDIIEKCAPYLENRPKYYVHVLFNRALVYLYFGPNFYDIARAWVKDLFEHCQHHPNWLANAFVLRSHLELRTENFDAALTDALEAYGQAGNRMPIRIEALLARGQAQLARNQLIAARADFEKALVLNDGVNQKFTVLGNLLLAEIAFEQKQTIKAYERLSKIKTLMPSIRYGSLINKYRQLSGKLNHDEDDYLIPRDTEDLHYKKFEEDLQRWLLGKALRDDSNVTRVAKRLQVTKKTIYLWLELYNMKP